MTQDYSDEFHKIRWKGGNQPWKKPLDVVRNPDHLTLGLRLAECTAVLRMGGQSWSWVGSIHGLGWVGLGGDLTA